jgi:hypothetical protein
VSLKSIIMVYLLSRHLRLGLISTVFPLAIPTKTSCAFLISPTRGTFTVSNILLDYVFLMIFGREDKL